MPANIKPRTGPPTADEWGHLQALRIILRIKEWPHEDSERRILFWMRELRRDVQLEEHARQERTRRARAKRALQEGADEDGD